MFGASSHQVYELLSWASVKCCLDQWAQLIFHNSRMFGSAKSHLQAQNLTKDHKPDLEVEKYRILKAGGFIQFGRVNGCLNLTRAIGDIEFKENKLLPADKQMVTADPELTYVELCNDDEFLVIACDGIWDCMSSQHLVDFIHEQSRTENNLKVICERVLDWCLAPAAGGLGCDNMTMILILFKGPNSGASVIN